MILRALAMILLLGVGACSVSTTSPEPAPVTVVWPPAPDVARIAYVKSFSRPDDLGIRKGFWASVRDFVFGADDSHLVRPMQVVETAQAIFVTDPGAKGVHRFDTTQSDYQFITLDKKVPLPSPIGVAEGRDGIVYVTDSKLAELLVIRPGSEIAQALATDVELLQPTGLAFDAAAREIYVVDTKAHCIRVVGEDGKLHRTLGKRGEGDGEFNYPTLLTRSADGRLWVTDSLNFRVQTLAADGRFLGKFGRLGDGTGDTARHKGVAVDSFGHVYVVDALFHALQIYGEHGEFLLSIGGQGHGPGEFWLPSGIFIGQGDRIYVADSYNQRVQVLRYVGGDS